MKLHQQDRYTVELTPQRHFPSFRGFNHNEYILIDHIHESVNVSRFGWLWEISRLQKECFWFATIANKPCTPLHIAANHMYRGER